MSKILLAYASDYIGMGMTLEDKRLYLNTAILAWNLSLFPEGEREEHMRAALRKLVPWNPGSKDAGILEHHLAILMKRRLTEFPTIKKIVVGAEISIVNGKVSLTTASIDFEETDDEHSANAPI